MNKDDFSKVYGGESQKSSIYYQDQRIGPCNLSSSIFYGGQDIIYPAQSSQNEGKKKSLVSVNIFINFAFTKKLIN